MTTPTKRTAQGKWVKCCSCAGFGLKDTFDGGPTECTSCNAGWVWEYPSGAHAEYPGGKFVAG